jgi:hypothetical protein
MMATVELYHVRARHPLRWFGLLDYRQDDIPERRFEKRHFYRKTPLFDHLVSFDVKLEATGPRH